MKRPLSWVRTFALLPLIIILSACGAPRFPHSPFTYDTAITMATPKVTSIDPVTAWGSGNTLFCEVAYGTLVSLNAKGLPEPELAKSWQASHRYRTWTVVLNPYAKWWSGRPVSASNVAWTLNFYKNAASGFSRRYELTQIASVRATSATTLVIQLKRPNPGFIANVLSVHGATWILPSFLFTRMPLNHVRSSDYLNKLRDMVGSGPFRPLHFSSAGLRWAANPHYFLGTPGVKYLRWQWNSPPAKALRQGTVQLAWTDSRLKDSKHYRVKRLVNPSFYAISAESTNPVWQNDDVRKALSEIIPRNTMPGVPAYTSIWPGEHDRTPLSSPAPLLAKAGFRRTKSGWTNALGQPLSFTWQKPASRVGQALAHTVANTWQHWGIQVRQVPLRYPGPVDFTLAVIHADPSPTPLSHATVSLMWPFQYWYVSPALANWTPNVWQPFYQVQTWRVRAEAQRSLQ